MYTEPWLCLFYNGSVTYFFALRAEHRLMVLEEIVLLEYFDLNVRKRDENVENYIVMSFILYTFQHVSLK
jgi:hypothetical protein